MPRRPKPTDLDTNPITQVWLSTPDAPITTQTALNARGRMTQYLGGGKWVTVDEFKALLKESRGWVGTVRGIKFSNGGFMGGRTQALQWIHICAKCGRSLDPCEHCGGRRHECVPVRAIAPEVPEHECEKDGGFIIGPDGGYRYEDQ